MKRKDMLFYRTTNVNFQGFNPMKSNVSTSLNQCNYHSVVFSSLAVVHVCTATIFEPHFLLAH